MIGIGSLIGIAASVYQAVKTYNTADKPDSKVDKLFSQLDTSGNGAIESADLQTAFDKIAAQATQKSEQLFAKLDADGNGSVTQQEFSSSINRLAEQLDDHYMRARMAKDNPGFSQEELAGAATDISQNFAKADTNGDGRLSIKEATDYGKTAQPGATTAERENVALMLQVMKLMQAYGGASNATQAAATKVSTSA